MVALLKRSVWFGLVVGLLLAFVVKPRITTVVLATAAFVTRFIPAWLAPVNWVLGLFLIAVCEGPLLKRKYLSFALYVLLSACFLFFLGSWNLHPIMSPVISVIGYIEANWLIPLWEDKLSRWVGSTPENPKLL